MTLKNDLFNSNFNFEDIINLFIRDSFIADSKFVPVKYSNHTYPYDSYETEDSVHINIVAVDLDNDDIKVFIENDILSVSSNKKDDDKNKIYFHQKIASRSFNYQFKVDSKYDLDKINIKLEKGLLKISIPISNDKKKREISIH